MNKQTKSAVVTGASTGIGRAIAQSLIDDGWRVFGSVRKEKDAEALQAALGDRFSPLIFDVTDFDAIQRGAETVASALGDGALRGLVNNAGIAVAGPVAYVPIEDVERQFDVNVYGPLRVTQAFLPLLGADKARKGARGKIVNMSSVAGKLTTPLMSPYAMSKHALEAMTDALRRELVIHGIDAVAVGPGAVKTPIWAKADDMDIDHYKDTEYYESLQGLKQAMQTVGAEGLPAEDIGDLVRDILNGRKRATRYAILKNKFSLWTLPRLMPTRMLDRAMAKRFGFKKS